MELMYVGNLNPVIKGVGILKKGQSFECLKEVGERLLKEFPREYISVEKMTLRKEANDKRMSVIAEKAKKSASAVRKEADKEEDEEKSAVTVKNKMHKPKKNKKK